MFLGLLALVTAVAAWAAAPEDDPDGPGPLPWRVGGELGFTVDVAAFPDSAAERLEVYLRLPPATLAALERQGEDSRLRVTVRLRNRFGAKQHEASLEFGVTARDTATGFGKVVSLPFSARGGAYRMQVRLEDVLSRKRGIAYLGRHVPRATTVEGEIRIPEPDRGLRLSDIEFTWGEAASGSAVSGDSATASEGIAGGRLPNPERLYGLLANELRARFQVRRGSDDRLPWHWRAVVLARDGREVAVRESTAAAGRTLTQDLSMDVSTEPAGGYELEVRTWLEGDARPVVRRAPFSIAWLRGSWDRNPRDLEDEVHFLFESEEEEAAFARMSPGEQERYLDRFWRDRDPTPGTAENQARLEFLGRVEHANRTWTRSGIGKGMFTDMGRVYIRHGEPDEILRQVIPAGDQTLTQLLQQLEITEDRSTGSISSKGLGGDVRPFEVWVYDGIRARPITAKPDPNTDRRSMRRRLFLFVDEQGYGDYRMRYTTE